MKYIVDVQEVWIQPTEVEANSKEEATTKISDGQGTLIEDGFVYSRTLSPDTWTVTECHEIKGQECEDEDNTTANEGSGSNQRG